MRIDARKEYRLSQYRFSAVLCTSSVSCKGMVEAQPVSWDIGELDYICCGRVVYDRIRANPSMTTTDPASFPTVAERS